MTIRLNDSVKNIIHTSVQSRYLKLLEKIGVKTIEDLINYYPVRYEDYSLISPISNLQPGEKITIIGKITSFSHKFTRKKGFTIQQAEMADETGKLKVVWFNHQFLKNIISPGINIAVAGLVERQGKSLVMQNPEFEIIKTNLLILPYDREKVLTYKLIHTARLVPVYPETKGLTSKWLRNKIFSTLEIKIEDWFPPQILTAESLLDLKTAIREIHFPSSEELLTKARNRLEFDEIFKFQANGLIRRKHLEEKTAISIPVNKQEINEFISSLPFKLTPGQTTAVDQILNDLNQTHPMNRLFQGDVGSGKTVVAAAAALSTIKAGFQAALMVPTQVLADQHAATLTNLLKPFGIKIALLTGTTKIKISEHPARLATRSVAGRPENTDSQSVRPSDYLNIRQSGTPSIPSFPKHKPDLIIGTQALIHNRAKSLIDTKRLALVIIDEQHRFGVEQRGELISRGLFPHVLSMTATPIPRTIALTLYSDLDVSTLTDLPNGRIPVKTWVVPATKRSSAYKWIFDQVKQGAQVFIICPFVEDSAIETLKSVKAVTSEFERLKTFFPGLKLSLVHGRIPSKEKTSILSAMKDGKIDILVATPVVEVGIDIPGAKIIVIEGAERFGLAQLHQLRGRVGRNNSQSYCLLFSTDNLANVRLNILERTSKGLELSEMDLKMRGPGGMWTTLQHGWPEFKIADIADFQKVNKIRLIAEKIINNLEEYPQIKTVINSMLEKQVALN
ncbi:ATP-dependent DNA helicase RecG [Candidatus Collierbacteria bacterium]|nr:ATP-dependent DNA helicase RecG [Candidatus Collierbacteria bacterium]